MLKTKHNCSALAVGVIDAVVTLVPSVVSTAEVSVTDLARAISRHSIAVQRATCPFLPFSIHTNSTRHSPAHKKHLLTSCQQASVTHQSSVKEEPVVRLGVTFWLMLIVGDSAPDAMIIPAVDADDKPMAACVTVLVLVLVACGKVTAATGDAFPAAPTVQPAVVLATEMRV